MSAGDPTRRAGSSSLGRLSALELRFEFSVFPPQFGDPAALVDELGRETAQRRAQSLGAKLEFRSW